MKPDRFAAQKIGVLKRALESCSKKRVEAGQAAAALDRELSRANREIIAQKKTIDDLSAWVTRSSVRIVELGNELREVKRARQLDGERIAEAVENANRVAAELRAALERSRARETALAQMVNEARARADNAPNCQPEPCPPSSVTGAACLLPPGHPADSPTRFHRYPPSPARTLLSHLAPADARAITGED